MQLLSALHFSVTFDKTTGYDKIPEIIIFYNIIKGGADILDQLCRKFIYQGIHDFGLWFFFFYNILMSAHSKHQ